MEWHEEGSAYTTKHENKPVLYSKEKVHRTKEAHKFLCICGYPSPSVALNLLTVMCMEYHW